MPAPSDAKNKANKKLQTPVFVVLISSLLIFGGALLFIGGVFDSPEPASAFVENSNNQASANNFHNGADFSKLEEIKKLEKYVAENPGDKEQLLKLGNLLNDSGFFEKAIEKYKDYLKFNPNNADVLVDLGICYYQLGDAQNALKEMKKALEVNPNHQIANFNIGIVNLSIGDKKEAKKYLNQAIKIEPNSEIARRAKSLLNEN